MRHSRASDPASMNPSLRAAKGDYQPETNVLERLLWAAQVSSSPTWKQSIVAETTWPASVSSNRSEVGGHVLQGYSLNILYAASSSLLNQTSITPLAPLNAEGRRLSCHFSFSPAFIS